MYMRYAGGGVGHYQVELNDAHSSESDPTDDVAADDEGLSPENNEEVPLTNNRELVPPNNEEAPPANSEELVPTNSKRSVPTNNEELVRTSVEDLTPTNGEGSVLGDKQESGLPQTTSEIDEDGSDSENGSNSDSASDESEGEGVAENDLPEDGEGGFIDAEDEEGYAEL